jgi:hypothetical protein
MRIRRELVERSTIDAFAEEHDLEMVITERRMDRWQRDHRLLPFMAQFRGVEVSDGSILRGTYGQGRSEAEAIADYARQISGERVVVDAMKETRRMLLVPRLVSAFVQQEP